MELFIDFSINDYVEQLNRIKEEIAFQNILTSNIDEEEIKIFLFILKNNGKKIIYNMKYISKSNIKYIIKKKLKKKFFINKFSLFFLLLYMQNKNPKITNEEDIDIYERKLKRLYKQFFKIIANSYYNIFNKDKNCDSIMEIDEIFEILRINLLLGFNQYIDKNYIFKISIHYLFKFFLSNVNNEKIHSNLNSLLSEIHDLLLKSKQLLHFLKRERNLDNFMILDITKFLAYTKNKTNEWILDILCLIYNNNYSNVNSDYLLDRIKECFYQLKENNNTKIIRCINNLYGYLRFLDIIIEKEESEKYDPCKPNNYFVFEDNESSGINYNSNLDIFSKSFTLVFSMKINEIKENEIYPLITYVNSLGNEEIIFNISIKNKKLELYIFGQKKFKSIDYIYINKCYLIIIEVKSISFTKKHFKIYINEKKCDFSLEINNDISNCYLKVGYLPNNIPGNNNELFKNTKRFVGIMGPIIQYSNAFDDNDFISSILNLKGNYASFLSGNKAINLDHYFEEFKYFPDNETFQNKNIYKDYSMKIRDDFEFSLCPLSILNNKNTNCFPQDIYGRILKIKAKESFTDFFTLTIPSSKSFATYAKRNQKSISVFVEYDGITIFTLIVEYFYNILRMQINNPKEEKTEVINAMCNVLSLIIKIFFKILQFFKLDFFSDKIDTFGFSIKKLFSLLMDIQPLNDTLIFSIVESGKKLIKYYENLDQSQTKTIILKFFTKFISLIFSSKFIMTSNYSYFISLFELTNSLIMQNRDLINMKMIDGLVSFSYVLDPSSFAELNDPSSVEAVSMNKEYKNLKKRYKNLLGHFIFNSNSLKLYLFYLRIIFSNQNMSWIEKYQLIKIYYKFHIVHLLYNDKEDKDSNKSQINTFKSDKSNKLNIFSQKDLLKEYRNSFSKLIDIYPPKDQKNETAFELLKSILILLIYEHKISIPLMIINESKEINNLKEKRSENQKNTIKSEDKYIEEITFFSSLSLEIMKNQSKNNSCLNNSLSYTNQKTKLEKVNEIEISNDKLMLDTFSEDKDERSDHSELMENKTNINNNDNYLFNVFLNSKNYSFYTIKGIFSCLCDRWDKKKKFQFIKSNEEDFFLSTGCITKFNRHKKELFYQFLCLIECINNENVAKKSIKLILLFIKEIVMSYVSKVSNQFNKTIFLHMLESKSIINKLFSLSLNNDILKDQEYEKKILNYIDHINNSALLYHPKSYIFSLIKNYIKTENPQTLLLIKNSYKPNIAILKAKNSELINSYQNSIRFIKTLLNVLEKNPDNVQNLFLKNNYELFYSFQNFVSEVAKLDTLYDPNLYVVNPYYYYHNRKDKKETKIFQSPTSKFLNKRIIFFYIVQIALNSIYLFWKVREKDKNIINICLDYITKFQEQIIINEHFIGYYLDLLNPFFKINVKNIVKQIPENIKNFFDNNMNNSFNYFSIRETKIISFSFFLIVMKFQSLLINFEKLKGNQNNEILIKKAFEPYINILENEIQFLLSKITKVKDNKNLEIMLEKEESKSEDFKNFNKNYYKYFLEKLKKKNNDFKSIEEEIQSKFILDENEKTQKLLNSLKTVSNNNYNDSKSEKSDKKENIRKNSYGEYSDDNEVEKEINKIIKNNKEIKINKESKVVNNSEKPSLDFEAQNPILCTKRDLILKNFGYFYYKYYFKNKKFIKLRKLFLYQNNPNDKINNFNKFEKSMKNNFPFIVKNFSNYDSYYPKVFYRPYKNFFNDKYFSISHPYFNSQKYDKSVKEKKMHLEYGHGLLNQSNFDLYTVSMKNESDLKDANMSSNLSKESDDDNIFNLESTLENILNKKSLDDDNSDKRENTNKNKSSKSKSFDIKKYISDFAMKDLNNNILKFECEKISSKSDSNGFIIFNKQFLIFQTNTKFNIKKYRENPNYLISCAKSDLDQEEKQIIIPYNLIVQVLFRKFLFYDVAVEIFLSNGKSYYFNFYNKKNKNEFIKVISQKINNDIIIKDSLEYFEKKKYLNKWLEGSLSTLDYLLLINKFTDRSYNVLSHYLILPWLFSNFNNTYNSENLRTFNYPGIFKSQEELALIVKEEEYTRFKHHFPNFISNYMYVIHYLFRIYPYINNQIKLQDNNFDEPARQFNSLIHTFIIFKENPHVNMELIPEFYFIPELFLNINYCYYGMTNKNTENYLVNNFGVGPDFHLILEIINYHQLNINSEIFTTKINKWIDYVFGESQLSIKKDSVNNFPSECYEIIVKGKIDEVYNNIKSVVNHKSKGEIGKANKNKNDNQNQDIDFILRNAKSNLEGILYKAYFYGHCPTQIFSKSHPAFTKKIEPKIYVRSNMDNLQLILKNERLFLDKTDILSIHESSKGNYFYIVCEYEILVYNKYLKLMNNLSINNICKFPYSLSIKYHRKDNFFKLFYNNKYLIFDVFDCKYFFIGGYLDNSLKIYYKDREKDNIFSIYVDSQFKSIKNSLDNKFLYTGHENGTIIKWSYQINPDNNQINILQDNSIRCHRSSVKMLELNEKYECIISVDIDELVFIRKMYDFELLSYIKINKYKKTVIDINICNQIIILTIFKIKTNEIFIYTYSLNGLVLGKIPDQLTLPISIIPNTDEMIIFSLGNIYFAKIAFNEKASLITISNNLDIIDLTSDETNDICYQFNEDLHKHKKDAISYFYDSKNRVLFCIFSNGFLYRINFVKNA